MGVGIVLEALARQLLPGSSDPVPDLASWLVDHVPGVTADNVAVRQVDAPGTSPGADGRAGTSSGPAVGDLEGVLAALSELTPFHDGVPGTVRVDRVVAADGGVSWMVYVPGTQTDQAGVLGGITHGGNPFTPAANVAALVGAQTASAALVTGAMRQAGVRPGEPVVIAGHSQGGMVAVGVANRVRQQHDVAGVVTVGSPNGHLEAPPGVPVLSLEHTQDGIPGMDHAPNPLTADWVTVERDLTEAADPDVADARDWTDSHALGTYGDTARLAQASDSPAVRHFLERVAPVLDGGSTSTSSYYEGELRIANVRATSPVTVDADDDG